MTHKKSMIVVFFGITLASQNLHAQNIELPTRYVQNTNLGVNNVPVNVLGSPYLNEKFIMGTVKIHEEESYQTLMRYNGFSDEIEMKDGLQTTSLMKRDYIQAIIDGELFSIHSLKENGRVKKGYFVELNQGKAKLLHRKKIILKEGRKATSSYSRDTPPKFEESFSHYLKIGQNEAVEIKLKAKDILAKFENEPLYDDLKNYVKKNRLKLKDEQEVIQFLNYYNSF